MAAMARQWHRQLRRPPASFVRSLARSAQARFPPEGLLSPLGAGAPCAVRLASTVPCVPDTSGAARRSFGAARNHRMPRVASRNAADGAAAPAAVHLASDAALPAEEEQEGGQEAQGEGQVEDGEAGGPRGAGQRSPGGGRRSRRRERGGRGGGAPRKGDVLELTCDSLAFKGRGVCRLPGSSFVVLCERALPGERLAAKVVRSRGTYAEAYKLASLSPHNGACAAQCPHFGPCGGCLLQTLAYDRQLAAKERQVADLLVRVGKFGSPSASSSSSSSSSSSVAAAPPAAALPPSAAAAAVVALAGGADSTAAVAGLMRPIIGCEETYHYRNKMEFSFSPRVWQPSPPRPDPVASAGPPQEGALAGATGAQPPAAAAAPRAADAVLAGGGGAGAGAEAEGAEPQPSGEQAEERDAAPAAEDSGAPEEAAPQAAGSGGAAEAAEGAGAEGASRAARSVVGLGLHVPRRFDKILQIGECHLQHPIANEILAFVREWCEQQVDVLPPYDVVSHEGVLRHLVIRKGSNPSSGHPEFLVNVVTKTDVAHLLRPLARSLTQRIPSVVSFLHTVNPSLSDALPPGTPLRQQLLSGRPFVTEALRGVTFEVSAASFFQPNTAQAELLYAQVEAACRLSGSSSECIVDLFCGAGTIGLSLARKVRHVFGFELVPAAVADARRNALRNSLPNASFAAIDLDRVLPQLPEGTPAPDVVIVDPNRPGLHPRLLQFLLALRAPRVVYVSCNPATLARDLDGLCHAGEGGGAGAYRLEWVQPVDMFPHTPHVECVAALALRG